MNAETQMNVTRPTPRLKRSRLVWLAAIAVVLLAGAWFFALSTAKPSIEELSFPNSDSGENADTRTLHSIRKVGNLYLVTSYGDYEARLQWLDDYMGKKAADLARPHGCSLFTARTQDERPLLGRNFDRPDKYPILAKFMPPGKYASFAFCPDEVSEHLRNLLAAGAAPSDELKHKFLYTLPFYAADGINEQGLAIAIAAAPIRRVKHSKDRQPTFVLLFIRRALDNCRNVEEVARLAETVSLYDRNFDTISHHFLVADADGNWLVIDYPEGALRLTRGHDTPQIRTQHFLEGGPSNPETRTSFSRYKKLNEALSASNPLPSDAEAMKLLERVRGETVWSVVYDLHNRGGLVAVRENYRTQYRFGFRPEERQSAATILGAHAGR